MIESRSRSAGRFAASSDTVSTSDFSSRTGAHFGSDSEYLAVSDQRSLGRFSGTREFLATTSFSAGSFGRSAFASEALRMYESRAQLAHHFMTSLEAVPVMDFGHFGGFHYLATAFDSITGIQLAAVLRQPWTPIIEIRNQAVYPSLHSVALYRSFTGAAVYLRETTTAIYLFKTINGIYVQKVTVLKVTQ